MASAARRSPSSPALILLICLVGGVFAPWVAPHDPFDLANLSLMDSLKPPAFLPDGDIVLPASAPTTRAATCCPPSCTARASACSSACCAVILALVVGITAGLVAGYAGGAIDAVLMRIADVQLTFPAILIALLVDGVVRAVLPRDFHEHAEIYVIVFAIGISALAAIRPHRARLHPGRARQGLRAGGARHRPLAAAHHGQPYPAQRARAGAGDRHAQPRARHRHRGDAVLPRRRPAADPALARHADPHRQRFPVHRASGGSRSFPA